MTVEPFPPTCHVLLIGYRGSGKSTIGRLLADRLRLPFVDLDDVIERNATKTIGAIFRELGELGFRDLEARALTATCGLTPAVIATGGGAILREDNRALMKRAGVVVWLRAPVDVLAERIAGDAATGDRRPPLTSQGQGGREEIESVLRSREPIYRALAEMEIDTEGRDPSDVVEAIAAELANRTHRITRGSPKQ